MHKPEILIISNRHDFACDYITSNLRVRGKTFLRLNSDDLSYFDVYMEPTQVQMKIRVNNIDYSLDEETLKVIYFRGPTYLRETSTQDLEPDQMLSKSQWAAFFRSLMIFERCFWVNHPSLTYKAENKAYQLKVAREVGFNIPKTIVTNSDIWLSEIASDDESVVVKGIDTVYLKVGSKLAFGYTNILNAKFLDKKHMRIAPMFIQEVLEPKIDIRITIIGDTLFAVKVLENENGIVGDWRLRKDNVTYVPFELPPQESRMCIDLMRRLELSYGAIDMALVADTYFFIEINPTGEWAWLVEAANLNIDEAISEFLIRKCKNL